MVEIEFIAGEFSHATNQPHLRGPRKLAEVIALLGEKANFQRHHRGILCLTIEWGKTEPIHGLSAYFSVSDRVYAVVIPASAKFKARSDIERTYDIRSIDRASFDSDGNLTLVNGQRLRAVEFVPAQLPYQVTDQEQKIIEAVLLLTGDYDRYCKNRSDDIPTEIRRFLPEFGYYIDYAALIAAASKRKWRPPGLKQIKYVLEDRFGLYVSLPTISRTLIKFQLNKGLADGA